MLIPSRDRFRQVDIAGIDIKLLPIEYVDNGKIGIELIEYYLREINLEIVIRQNKAELQNFCDAAHELAIKEKRRREAK